MANNTNLVNKDYKLKLQKSKKKIIIFGTITFILLIIAIVTLVSLTIQQNEASQQNFLKPFELDGGTLYAPTENSLIFFITVQYKIIFSVIMFPVITVFLILTIVNAVRAKRLKNVKTSHPHPDPTHTTTSSTQQNSEHN